MSAAEAHETSERAAEAHHKNDPFVNRVSITIALLAVFAAVVTSLETIETAASIRGSSEAVLYQDKATDAWNEYQADSLKRHMYLIAANVGGAFAAGYKQEIAHQADAQSAARAKATGAESQREHALETAEAHERRHHWLAGAAALIEIAIGVCSVAIVARDRRFWWGALALGAAGAVVFALAWAG